jgi:hypothetical protein
MQLRMPSRNWMERGASDRAESAVAAARVAVGEPGAMRPASKGIPLMAQRTLVMRPSEMTTVMRGRKAAMRIPRRAVTSVEDPVSHPRGRTVTSPMAECPRQTVTMAPNRWRVRLAPDAVVVGEGGVARVAAVLSAVSQIGRAAELARKARRLTLRENLQARLTASESSGQRRSRCPFAF